MNETVTSNDIPVGCEVGFLVRIVGNGVVDLTVGEAVAIL